MKKIISYFMGFLMFVALLVGSGDPMPDIPAKEIIITELACLAVLAAGALWFRKLYRDNKRQ